jgi:transcriptional regulator of acetoin/glycerol metabolism
MSVKATAQDRVKYLLTIKRNERSPSSEIPAHHHRNAQTLHRWLNDGIIPGEQLTPGAPWRIRLADDLIARFSETAGDGFVTMHEATRKLGVSRQTVLQRVKRGELEVVHVTNGRKKGIRIKVITRQSELFDRTS